MTPIVRTCRICFGTGCQGADACMNCSGTGATTDVESSFDQYEAREPLVQEVVKIVTNLEQCDTHEEVTLGKKYLLEAARKLAEWKL